MVVHVINVYYLINLFYNSFYDNSYIKIQLEVEGDINSLNLQSCKTLQNSNLFIDSG